MLWFIHEALQDIRPRNADDAEHVDISDILHLIDNMFTGGSPPAVGQRLCGATIRLKPARTRLISEPTK